ncbi:hypothetical protein [Desulfosporosinus metallidurans]|uniref:Uncharacterized protein n=1 Tax=Desulfosporosinus metallidurans TaxID=1888891 RepID=A0A1Q8QMW6_9FIRM|nr:hypothetical protein [Desulfosporosinus metallidurans]OLN28669.1 hypothetical protein DSOL_3904 [Desulfosporosinus metallidurans]
MALSLIMVGQNVIGEASERRAIETHDCVMEELALVQEELYLAREERDRMKQLMSEIHKQTKGRSCKPPRLVFMLRNNYVIAPNLPRINANRKHLIRP